ncbi:MAG: potassium-transporting ATPase subunit C, partial [Acidobacteriales bacterium]|nr:potassium-transporting ATPase subunit C [Terriglobales bacterium]
IDRVSASVAAARASGGEGAVPIDMVTTSASGLDPDITPANAEFQAARVALARHMRLEDVRALIRQHTAPRQLGVQGEPRVNVLELNLALDGTK